MLRMLHPSKIERVTLSSSFPCSVCIYLWFC